MAGAFSGHLLETFDRSTLISSGPMSFNPNMHGTQQSFMGSQPSFAMYSNSQASSLMFQEVSEATAVKIASLQAKLNQKLGPEYISQRPGPGGTSKLTYAEGWKIINLANEVFGFNGWSSSIVNMTTDFMDYNEEARRYNIGVSAVVRVTLRDGVFHEDVGYGMIENTRSKGQGLDKCKKEAVTDGLKRALRSFGNLLGNCLYDKSYTQEVVKIKVPPAKFNKDDLHRRPEFQDVKPNVSASASSSSASAPPNQSHSTNQPSRSYHTSVSAPPVTIKREPTPGPSNLSASTSNRPPQQQSRPQAIPPTAQSNQSRPQNAVQPQPDVQRQVSFAPQAVAPPPQAPVQDSEDSYPGFSDDDAFLAALGDLDGDMGHPIGLAEDLGRPIEEDTDTGPPLHYADSTVESISAAPMPPPQSISAHRPVPPRQANGANRPSRSRLEAIIAAQMEQESEQALRDANASGSSSSTMGSSDEENGKVSGPSRLTLPQASTSGGQQRSTPVGGFHFPAGMNNPLQNRGSTGSGVGTKRPLDASAGAQGSRSMRPGMGLQQAAGGSGYGDWQGPDGADTKRIRR